MKGSESWSARKLSEAGSRLISSQQSGYSVPKSHDSLHFVNWPNCSGSMSRHQCNPHSHLARSCEDDAKNDGQSRRRENDCAKLSMHRGILTRDSRVRRGLGLLKADHFNQRHCWPETFFSTISTCGTPAPHRTVRSLPVSPVVRTSARQPRPSSLTDVRASIRTAGLHSPHNRARQEALARSRQPHQT